jgi:cbb3-type cytochrome oxidase cytochrome c subunit
MGPDLTAVTAERSTDWIQEYLKDPKTIYPRSRMPAFSKLSKAERKAVARYLAE